MAFDFGKWIVANGLQVWVDGPTAHSSPRICTVQNAALPVKQFSVAEQAKLARLIGVAPDLLAEAREFVRRVEIGEVRSKRTYASFKAIIAQVDGAA